MGLQPLQTQTVTHSITQISMCYLDDLVLRPEAGSLCWRVLIHSSDELARFGLLAVQVEAVAARPLLQVAESRPRPVPLLLGTETFHRE